MSGLVKDNIFGSSGVVLAAAGGLSWQSVVTASTVTVSAGKGYFINTTSNACTITLPSSAEAGDQIILVDYARNWGTNAITIDSNGLKFVEYNSYAYHYSDTLIVWREEFNKKWGTIKDQGFDLTFKKMWQFYLSYCEAGFKSGNIDLIQFSLYNK